MTKIWKAKQLTIIMDYILPNRNCYNKSIFQIFFMVISQIRKTQVDSVRKKSL